jgi:hypothetical protein
MKPTNDGSLRFLVEKWLAPATFAAVHVTEFGRTRRGGTRYVQVADASFNSHALFFFRHRDGCWRVFPPASEGMRMKSEAPAA